MSMRTTFRHAAQAAVLGLAVSTSAWADLPGRRPMQRPAAAVQPAAATAPVNEAQIVVAKTLFDWAETAYQGVLPGGYDRWENVLGYYSHTPQTQFQDTFTYRYYAGSNNYLGMAGEDVYVLGPVSRGAVQRVGTAADFACGVNPKACASNGPDDGPLFVTEWNRGQISVLRHKAPAPGTAVAGRTFMAPTNMMFGGALAYDARNDRLFASAGESGVWVLDGAKNLSGQLPASTRRIVSTVPVEWYGLPIYDRDHDVLYVIGSGHQGSRLLAFANASTLNGTVTPTRVLSSAGDFHDLAIDFGRSIAYVSTDSGIAVVSDIQNAQGTFVPARTFALQSGARPSILSLDASRDRLYMTDGSDSTLIHVVSNASSRSGANVPSTKVSFPSVTDVTVDTANDRLYVGGYGQIYIVNGASGLTTSTSAGTSTPLPAGTVVLKGNIGMNLLGFAVP